MLFINSIVNCVMELIGDEKCNDRLCITND